MTCRLCPAPVSGKRQTCLSCQAKTLLCACGAVRPRRKHQCALCARARRAALRGTKKPRWSQPASEVPEDARVIEARLAAIDRAKKGRRWAA